MPGVIEKIARAVDPHPFVELDNALARFPDDADYIARLRMHTEMPMANARKAVEVIFDAILNGEV